MRYHILRKVGRGRKLFGGYLRKLFGGELCWLTPHKKFYRISLFVLAHAALQKSWGNRANLSVHLPKTRGEPARSPFIPDHRSHLLPKKFYRISLFVSTPPIHKNPGEIGRTYRFTSPKLRVSLLGNRSFLIFGLINNISILFPLPTSLFPFSSHHT